MPRSILKSARRTAMASGRAMPGTARGARRDQLSHAILVLQQFRELFRVSQQHFQKIEARCGVSGAQLWALSELDANPGLKISELAALLSVHVSTASNLLDKLEAKQFIRRERATSDQRVVRVFVTTEGRACMRRAPQPIQGVIPDALHRMPPPALRRLYRDLDVLLALASIRNPKAAHRHLAEP